MNRSRGTVPGSGTGLYLKIIFQEVPSPPLKSAPSEALGRSGKTNGTNLSPKLGFPSRKVPKHGNIWSADGGVSETADWPHRARAEEPPSEVPCQTTAAWSEFTLRFRAPTTYDPLLSM